MLPQEIIRRKRDGKSLSTEELQFFASGIADGSISEGQVAAFGMAVFFQGMSAEETALLTLAMRDTGDVLNWDSENLSGPLLDKHSTGGVADSVSLMLGPLVAACGGFVPMISGRGLGHTGGTLDKLDAIPGYNTVPENALFRKTVRECGLAIIGQTGQLAPADKRFYATRDITATVESIPLITASILCKKFAEGLDALVMDVKTGSGAFMSEYESARELALSITQTANAAGIKTQTLITDMNQPLGNNAGNALEIRETIEFLTSQHLNPRLKEIVFTLSATLLQLGGLAKDKRDAMQRLETALTSGKAAEIFSKMAHLLGGPPDLLENYTTLLPTCTVARPVFSDKKGFVKTIDTRALGLCLVELGGGRRRAEDKIDYAVGLEKVIAIGQNTELPLATIHAKSEDDWQRAAQQVKEAITFSQEAPELFPIIYETI